MQERPNTVAGLTEKHAELTKLRALYEAKIKRITVDIDHLDAAMRLFQPDPDAERLATDITKHKVKKGSVMRFVMAQLREADGPLTSRQITEAWCAERGLVADDATYATLRKRIGACLKSCESRGLIKNRGWTTDRGENGSYKLWGLAD